MKSPKEDPNDKAARERERRLAELDQNAAAQKDAGGLTTDLRSVYGLRSLSLFGTGGIAPKPVVQKSPLPGPGTVKIGAGQISGWLDGKDRR